MNVDPQEINKFSQLADQWWDPQGKFKTLHHINPTRLAYIHQHSPLMTQQVLDVGCGGGILSEAMAQMGAQVTGIDLSETLIEVAQRHAQQTQVSIQYQVSAIEDLMIQSPATFDIVTCLEMLEHVPDPAAIVHACATASKPGGALYFSTINRTWQAYVFAILGAEYIFKLLPKQTHDYQKFIQPAQLVHWCEQAGLTVHDIKGLHYNPFTQRSTLTENVSINYLVYCQKPSIA
ncbi:MAG: bifunctional 2-polyprenyl-6-hydroxyphenol methylase/3-demethylubiquinol 3-O-methyltransferase UbiG [Legionellales bacterium]|nr:bifunctional 2-polyprenyl-6-hydroxyphenol methylase/3-demethylubiquinol 3-O-methyltransferase UbiG [Legionellales bacterium]